MQSQQCVNTPTTLRPLTVEELKLVAGGPESEVGTTHIPPSVISNPG